MVKNICSRFGIEPSDGVTKLAYIESGNVYILASDEQLTTFLQSVAGLDPPATLYVYDDVTTGNDVISEKNREDNSNIGDQHVYGHTSFDNAEILSNDTYGVSSQYTSTSYVPETQQAPEEADTEEEDDEDEDEEEDEDEDEVRDIDPDNYVYQIPDDFHDFPPHPRSDDVVITPNQAIRYSRREKVKLHQVFRTKGDLTLALGLKFIQEGFEFRTPRSCKKRYEAICAQKNCGWRVYASCLGGSTMFQVRTLNDVHTCSMTQMHSANRNASRRVLSHLLLDKTNDVRRDLRAADIIKDMKAQHKINISY
ncbi:hypothetical protein OSB04_024605 [Centaurea solstitialis]|uniref:Transposase MuDR plant domain-containing protein n=1 Tax=Centaurea solstitialis TaxID=347529 RepID=A0AA38T5X4_9ASTR|nr:hypothetical protein OSB04_024605 [Centaurea solstitialis]